MQQSHIRNFSIIAHIDHGKSTLADRILEKTNTISSRESVDQFLDNMEIEKERGITIKAQAVRIKYKALDGQEYYFHLIDTPGHVDFTYEVSRSLAACEGALLVVDASQGVEAQTLANVYLAMENNLEIIPVLNKVDLPHADVKKVKKEIEDIIGLDTSNALEISAKTGLGVEGLLEQIVAKVPSPKGNLGSPFRALIFDSWFDNYLGVVIQVRVFDGKIKKKQRIYFLHSQQTYEVVKLGVHSPHFKDVEELSVGDVGIIICGIKTIKDVKIGDTLCVYEERERAKVLSGFKEVKPMVFCGIFPVDSSDHTFLKDSLEKLALNDSSLRYVPESSTALGLGFRCGFLGMLHMNIVQERLEREFGLKLVCSAPSCIYQLILKNGETLELENPSDFPDPSKIEDILEPYVQVVIHCSKEYLGNIITLCIDRRGIQHDMHYLTPDRVQLTYDFPLVEIVYDFYNRLKEISKGYASMDYEFKDYRISDLVKVDILVNGSIVDALSFVCHRQKSQRKSKDIVNKLSKIISRQQFDIAIQASIGSKIIGRETVKALRKNVLAKCYGGDITRKRKLLEKQKEGKKRMKMVGNVEIPQEAFMAVLKLDEE